MYFSIFTCKEQTWLFDPHPLVYNSLKMLIPGLLSCYFGVLTTFTQVC